jgi:hypothetical protein
MDNPNLEHVSTSVAEQHKLSICVSMGRFPRDDVSQAGLEM